MIDVDERLRAAAVDVRMNVRAGDTLGLTANRPRRLVMAVAAALVVTAAVLPAALLLRPTDAPRAEQPGPTAAPLSVPATVPAPVAETTSTAPESAPVTIAVLGIDCSVEPIAGHVCENLIDGDPATEYQFEMPASGSVRIELKFAERVSVSAISWSNIEDPQRFSANRSVELLSIVDDTEIPYPVDLDPIPGGQVIPYVSLPTFSIDIEIHSAHAGDGTFDEVAIAELAVLANAA